MGKDSNFIHIHLKPEMLQLYGLPDIAYPMPEAALPSIVQSGGELPFAALLFWIQQRLSATDADARELSRAVLPLCQCITTPDDHATGVANGDEWVLYLGEVDLNHEIATVQQADRLLAAASEAPVPGEVLVSVYEPLSGKDIERLLQMGGLCQPKSYSGTRTNWDFTQKLYSTDKIGNAMAAEAGRSYRSYWKTGLGIDYEGNTVSSWHEQRSRKPLPPWLVATQIGVWYELSQDKGEAALHTLIPKNKAAYTPPPAPYKHNIPRIRRCQRVMRMVHELHKQGYQGLRIQAELLREGQDWELRIFASSELAEDAVYLAERGHQYFGWTDANTDDARALAEKFVARFPRLCEVSITRDWRYCGWYAELLGWVDAGFLPIGSHPDASRVEGQSVMLARIDDTNADKVFLPPAPGLPH